MKQTAIIVAPGRGTYNKAELGYFKRHHPTRDDLLNSFDETRAKAGQVALRELDSAARYSNTKHTQGDNASGLIHACAYADFLSIDRDRFDVIGVTGNSMGWYIALACAGAVGVGAGFDIVNTMGTLMHEFGVGGQSVYPVSDEDWRENPDLRAEVNQMMAQIDQRDGHDLRLSIDLGGMIAIAGNEQGLNAFETEMARIGGRFAMRLRGHAAFHTDMQAHVADKGQARLGQDLFDQPLLPLIDGRGAIWWPHATAIAELRSYTLGHQVIAPYGFFDAIKVAARELMPDVFIVLGPGTTLGGSVAQSLVRTGWRGMSDKSSFKARQAQEPILLSMGRDDQRELVTGRT